MLNLAKVQASKALQVDHAGAHSGRDCALPVAGQCQQGLLKSMLAIVRLS